MSPNPAERSPLWIFIVQTFLPIGYAVLSSGLVFIIPHAFGLPFKTANNIVGSFLALIYLLNVIGGLVLNKWISPSRLLSLGNFLQGLGFLGMCSAHYFGFRLGLSLYAVGFGFAIPCINILLMKRICPSKLERAFFWSFSCVNIGFTAGFLICGFYIPKNEFIFLLQWMAALYILLSLLCAIVIKSDPAVRNHYLKMASVTLLVLIFAACFLAQLNFARVGMLTIGALGFIYMGYQAQQIKEKSQRQKLWIFNFMALCILLFWSLSMIASMGLMLFLAKNVSLHFLGIKIAPQWVRSLNVILVIIGGPLLKYGIEKINHPKERLKYPHLFLLGLLFTGLSFIILGVASFVGAAHIPFGWVICFSLVSTVGLLFIAPVSPALVNRLTPLSLKVFANSFVLLLAGVGSTIAIHLSNWMITGERSQYTMNAHLGSLFLLYSLPPLGMAILLGFFARKFSRIISQE